MTQHEMEMLVQQEVKELDTYLDQHDYTNAVNRASWETGWSLPVTDGLKIHWMIERAKRFLYSMLISPSSYKFKVKQYSLQHRFQNLFALVKQMDADWKEFQEQMPSIDDAVAMGGTKIDAGFAYDEDTGRDRTYDLENFVLFRPTESD